MNAPLKFCAAPRCPERVKSGYCTLHQPIRNAQHYPTDPRYGSRRWRNYSSQRLAEHPFCELCGYLAEVTDHRVPVTVAPQRFFDETNHRSLCRACNRAEQARWDRMDPTETAPRQRFVVCGPPGAGKTTWVEQRATMGDIVWDLDKVADVVAQTHTFPYPPLVLDALLAMRAGLINWLASDDRATAYVIVAKEETATQLARLIHASVVCISPADHTAVITPTITNATIRRHHMATTPTTPSTPSTTTTTTTTTPTPKAPSSPSPTPTPPASTPSPTPPATPSR